MNGPAFASSTPKTFLANLKLLAATTDRAEGFKKAFSATMQKVDTVLETVGIASATVQTLGGAPNTHPLGETYYSQVCRSDMATSLQRFRWHRCRRT